MQRGAVGCDDPGSGRDVNGEGRQFPGVRWLTGRSLSGVVDDHIPELEPGGRLLADVEHQAQQDAKFRVDDRGDPQGRVGRPAGWPAGSWRGWLGGHPESRASADGLFVRGRQPPADEQPCRVEQSDEVGRERLSRAGHNPVVEDLAQQLTIAGDGQRLRRPVVDLIGDPVPVRHGDTQQGGTMGPPEPGPQAADAKETGPEERARAAAGAAWSVARHEHGNVKPAVCLRGQVQCGQVGPCDQVQQVARDRFTLIGVAGTGRPAAGRPGGGWPPVRGHRAGQRISAWHRGLRIGPGVPWRFRAGEPSRGDTGRGRGCAHGQAGRDAAGSGKVPVRARITVQAGVEVGRIGAAVVHRDAWRRPERGRIGGGRRVHGDVPQLHDPHRPPVEHGRTAQDDT